MTGDLDEMPAAVRDVRDLFVELTEPHRPALWEYCVRLTGSPWDAEDLVQDTLLRAFARLGHVYQPLDHPRAYLFRIATNGWIDEMRRARIPLGDPGELEAVPTEGSGDLGLRSREALGHLVRHLPPRQRVTFLLSEVFDFRDREIGGMLGISTGAVKALLHRARGALKASLGDTAAPGRGGGEGGGSLPVATVDPSLRKVLDAFVDAFNRRDPDALASLLDQDATAEILGVAEERGREVIRAQSLAEGLAHPTPQEAQWILLAGEPVVLVHYPRPTGERALGWIIRPGISDGRISTWRTYFYTPELLDWAGGELGVPVESAGYRYVPLPEGEEGASA